MSDNAKKPKWLKRIKYLLKSDDKDDVESLIKVLTRLEDKAEKLYADLMAAKDPQERQRINEKMELLIKYRRKGLNRLKELLDARS
ncbi:MAG: hypothetical protein P8X74_08940 [Reinekea sp.]|jgi:hypothetical protein